MEYCQEIADEAYDPRFDPMSGLLVLPICGVLLKGADPELEAFCGYYNIDRLADLARTAATDPRVRGVALLWDSPGGYVTGMDGVTAALTGITVPVISLVTGYCCSLAYIFANAAGPIQCMPGSIIGSIGVMATTYDTSAAYTQIGIQARLFTDGKYKGLGTPGIPWSADWYSLVEDGITTLSTALRAGITATRPQVTIENMQGQSWEVEAAPAALHDGITPAPDAEAWLSDLSAHLTTL
jgi:ClpP class serine protease